MTNASHKRLTCLQASATSPNQCTLRGGNSELAVQGNYPAINQFLSTDDREKSLDRFFIHGWRWHTASLVRESGRLCTLAQKARKVVENGDVVTEALQQAIDYVVGFNMKGLHRIESDLMFPWMRERLTTAKDMEPSVSQEFDTVMSQLESTRHRLVNLGEELSQSVFTVLDKRIGIEERLDAIQKVIDKSASLQNFAKEMMVIENTLLVPAIAKIVPESEQHSFNKKVLRNLGLWDSRLHLVAMYEAIQESGDKIEKAIFEQSIPSIPQMMIPRWKRKLYEPKAGVLDSEL